MFDWKQFHIRVFIIDIVNVSGGSLFVRCYRCNFNNAASQLLVHQLISISEMKTIFLLLFGFAGFFSQPWQTDFEKATIAAKEQHRPILLYFSGSDWCGPCMRLRKEIFESPAFIAMADSSLVLVNADFPRNRKNQLEKSLQQQNDHLASQYNEAGKFPLTVLIDAETGKELGAWEGFPKESAEKFIEEIKQQANALSER